MFSDLSWSDYLQTVLWLLAIYYTVVLVCYYRKDMTRWLARKPKATPALLQPVIGNEAAWQDTKQTNVSPADSIRQHETPPSLIQTLKDEVAAFIPEAISNGFEKEALLSSLAFILSKYSSPDIVLYREAIEQWILEQCRKHSSVRLSESELAGLWNS